MIPHFDEPGDYQLTTGVASNIHGEPFADIYFHSGTDTEAQIIETVCHDGGGCNIEVYAPNYPHIDITTDAEGRLQSVRMYDANKQMREVWILRPDPEQVRDCGRVAQHWKQ